MRAGSSALAAAVTGLWLLAHPLSAQVVQITPDQAALRVRYEKGMSKYVKVAFFRGGSLRPLPPGKSKHKEVRYLDIHDGDQLDEAQIVGWVKQASRLPGWGGA